MEDVSVEGKSGLNLERKAGVCWTISVQCQCFGSFRSGGHRDRLDEAPSTTDRHVLVCLSLEESSHGFDVFAVLNHLYSLCWNREW